MNNALFELFKDEIIEIANTRIDAFLGDKVNMMIRKITQKTHLTWIQMIKEKCNYTTELAMEVLSVPQSERDLYAKLAE